MSIQDTALTKAINLLKIAGVPYGMILPDGTTAVTDGYTFGLTPTAPEIAKPKRKLNVPLGFYMNLYIAHIKDLKPGETATIPVGEGVDPEGLRAAACGYASKHWGNQTYMTETDRKNRVVTIARIL